MSDKPIIFSAPMVRALLAGEKTQTRRMLYRLTKNLRSACFDQRYPPPLLDMNNPDRMPGETWTLTNWGSMQPGDRLWVRETWADVYTGCGPGIGYKSDGALYQPEYDCEDFGAGLSYDYAKYPGKYTMWFSDLQAGYPGHAWRSPIHMPRWASRLTLIVTDVRVQRLQLISEDDAVAEGATKRAASYGFRSLDDGWSMDWSQVGGLSRFASGEQVGKDKRLTECDVSLIDARAAFASFINRLHGGKDWNLKPSNLWDANPWVAALTFRVIPANIDAGEARAA